MEHLSVLERPSVSNDIYERDKSDKFITSLRTVTNPVLNRLLSEGCSDFFWYIKWLGLAKKSDMLVLSSIHHYYYDLDDIEGIKVLVNIRKLNLIRHLDSFLRTVIRLLPPKAFLVGCFQDDRKNVESDISYNKSKFNGRFINSSASATGRRLSVRDVTMLLERNGFGISDISRISGLMYFCSQNIRISN